jgi:hypothetical protein
LTGLKKLVARNIGRHISPAGGFQSGRDSHLTTITRPLNQIQADTYREIAIILTDTCLVGFSPEKSTCIAHANMKPELKQT